MSKPRRGFTLVELLAVIVILAIILVIAVPQIMNVITEARKGALISSAKLIAGTAETTKLSNDTLGINKAINCEDVSKLNSEDYDSCTITFDSNGKAKVTIVGKGKFEGMSVCDGTKENAEVSSKCIIPTDTACFSYQNNVSSFDINKEACMTYATYWDYTDEEKATYCAGGELEGLTMKDEINLGHVTVERLETKGVISNVQYSESGISITDYNDTCSKDVIIPSKIGDKSVVYIGEWSFYDYELSSVTIPDSVTTIGEGAFRSNKLTSVTVPNSVTTIGEDAFADNQLTSVTIPNSVTTIGIYAFRFNQLTSVTIPDSVTTIGEYAFDNNQLTSVIIPDSVTYIGQAAFNDNKLSDDDAFIYKRNSDGSIDNTNVVSYGGAKKDIIIPNSVATIGSYAFYGNDLTSVTLGNSVTTIGDNAFEWNHLTNVTIGNSVTTIGDNAFAENELTNIIIPDSVTSIDSRAFSRNQLTSVTIPNSVTTIGEWAFSGNQLTSVTIPDSVTTIGNYAFYKSSDSNPNLTSIINTAGRSFDWSYIITGSSGTSSITGTYDGVSVTTE